MKDRRQVYIKKMHETLLVEKKWRYLRYLHLREAFRMVSNNVEDVLVVGAGKGLAEITLAMEFPEIHFHLTDVKSKSTPNWRFARRRAREWKIKNIRFSIVDIMNPPVTGADFVCSTEVLEHLGERTEAAYNMCNIARKYIYCLVPFADKLTNRNTRLRERAFRRHGHYVCGLDKSELVELFPNPIEIRGCYWREHGYSFRTLLEELEPDKIRADVDKLIHVAANDITPGRIPEASAEAQGIWILSKTIAANPPKTVAANPLLQAVQRLHRSLRERFG